MCPQLVDFDADGRLDLVMGTFEGTAFVLPRAENGYGEWRRITDRAGRDVLLAQFWNRTTEAWDSADRSPVGAPNPPDHGISAAAVDWDGDGDLDLLLGAKEGRLYVQRNEGTRSAPLYSGVNEPVVTSAPGRAPLTVPGGCTAPRVVDWNGDGRFDLVCGSFEGGVFVYVNQGSRSEPRFGTPLVLVPNAAARGADDGGPRRGTYVDAVDYDGDGDLDLLVGGYVPYQPPARELTDVERARLSEIEALISQLDEQLMAWFDTAEKGPDGEYTEAAMEDYRAIAERLAPLESERDRLRPTARDLGRVVWYERIG